MEMVQEMCKNKKKHSLGTNYFHVEQLNMNYPSVKLITSIAEYMIFYFGR